MPIASPWPALLGASQIPLLAMLWLPPLPDLGTARHTSRARTLTLTHVYHADDARYALPHLADLLTFPLGRSLSELRDLGDDKATLGLREVGLLQVVQMWGYDVLLLVKEAAVRGVLRLAVDGGDECLYLCFCLLQLSVVLACDKKIFPRKILLKKTA
jgi:hypothetical protein